MRILNRTKQTVIAEDVRRAVTFGEKLVGLLHRTEARPLLLKTRFGIHTFGMKFPIDVVVFDQRGIIKMVQRSMRPGSFVFWKPTAAYALELPEWSVDASRTEVGDEVAVIETES
ncbi:MAG: DUF192 domain-containing protein [bacterium]|nr:DUF192 domain-containing protein [bacterium]